jgi:putative flippase GtrA
MDEQSTPNLPQPENRYGQLAGQFFRFAMVGLVNTIINFGVLNLLSWLTGIKSGPQVIYLSIIAFIAATTNSYYMNKRWAFRDPSTSDFGKEFSMFLLVSVGGAIINSGTIYLITTHVQPIAGLSATLWLNLSNIVGIGLGLIWNFIGYRTFVFKDR